ncbi:MAG: tRNA pseudouridine(55) synthase TruB [Candidatus Omnitrophica bacterium]|nr:tRNA pseudouridine(55) synthase TruB [Candidatus Omnitrophota bacterium]
MNYASGLLLVDKPGDTTSHDVVDFIRKKFEQKKVGHAGTLDPFATGLLLILLGGFTKRSKEFSDCDKEYEAVLELGASTDTGDREGKIISEKKIPDIREGELQKVFLEFSGKIKQVPPMFSAKKIKGKKLYDLARRGIVVKREPKEVFIHSLKILDFSLPRVSFYAKCSKGTYIRQLAHDIGERIGCGGYLSALRRTFIGPFSVREALPLDKLENAQHFYENILQPQ